MLCRFDKFLSDEMPTMKQITNKEYEVEKAKGHVLLPDTVRFICEANGYDAEKIGQHFLEILPKIRLTEQRKRKRLRADVVQRRCCFYGVML